MDPGRKRGWKTSFHYKLVMFRVYVNLPEGNIYATTPTWWLIPLSKWVSSPQLQVDRMGPPVDSFQLVYNSKNYGL